MLIENKKGKVVVLRTVYNNTYSRTSFFVPILDGEGKQIQKTDFRKNPEYHASTGEPVYMRKPETFYTISHGGKAKSGYDLYLQIKPEDKILGDTVIDNEKVLAKSELTPKHVLDIVEANVAKPQSTWTYYAADYKHDNLDAYRQAVKVAEREKEIAELKAKLENVEEPDKVIVDKNKKLLDENRLLKQAEKKNQEIIEELKRKSKGA